MEDNDRQRSVVVIDRTRHERRPQTLASAFRITGHRWGKMQNLAEVPLFADSQATRRLLPFLDQDGPALHGLVHVPKHDECTCPACAAQRGENWRI